MYLVDLMDIQLKVFHWIQYHQQDNQNLDFTTTYFTTPCVVTKDKLDFVWNIDFSNVQ